MRGARPAAALLVTLPGCALFVDLDSSGYRNADSGDALAVTCDADAMCSTLALGCVAAKDCAAGQVCCLGGTPPSSSFACEMGPACSSPVQLCQTDGECIGVRCVSQQCSFGGSVLTFQACGNLSFCSPGP
jgi:hypothetical protein